MLTKRPIKRFGVRFLAPSKIPALGRAANLFRGGGGAYGELQIFSGHLSIVIDTVGPAYFSGCLLGPLFFFLEPFFREFFRREAILNVDWEDINAMQFHKRGAILTISGIDHDGNHIQYSISPTCEADKVSEFLNSIAQYKSILGFRAY